MTTDTSVPGLTPRQYQTLDVLVRVPLPHVDEGAAVELSSGVAARAGSGPVAGRQDILAALDVLGSRLAGSW